MLQRLDGADALEDLAGRTRIALVHEVAEPEFNRIQTELLGNHVVVLLERPAGRRAGWCANRAGRLRVGVDDIGWHVDVWDPGRPDGKHRRHLAEDRLGQAVSAPLYGQAGAARPDPPLPSGAGRHAQ